jgi:hypothetical protein
MHTVNAGHGVFRSKKLLLPVLAACFVEVFLSGRSIARTTLSVRDWILVLGLLFCDFIFIALTFRTKVTKQRFLFGAVSLAFVLWTVLAATLPSQETAHILRWFVFLAWICATLSGIAIFF